MPANNRDAGLVRAVGSRGLAASMVNTMVGAGIFAVPAALAAAIGPYAPLAFVACAIAIGAVAVCWAEGGSRIASSGGAYACIEKGLGPLPAYVAGTLLWVSDALAGAGIAAALADALVPVLPPGFRPAARIAAIVLVLAAVAGVNLRGIRSGVRLVSAVTAVKFAPLVIFLAAGAGAMHGDNFAASAHATTHGLGRALILAFFSLTGMEVVLSASGEVLDPARTIPRALAGAVTAVTLLYLGIQVVAQGVLGPALPGSAAPLADAMGRIHPALGALMLTGTALCMFGFICSDILGTPRMLFAFGREGALPRALGRVQPRTHVPYVAITAYALLEMSLALTGTFAELAVLSTLASAVLYMLGCAAAWLLARRGVALAGAPLKFRWLTSATIAGCGGMLLLIALASRAEILGLIGLMSIAAVAWLATSGRRTRLGANAGADALPEDAG